MSIRIEYGPSMFDYGEVVANAAARVEARRRSEVAADQWFRQQSLMQASMGPQVMPTGGGGGGGQLGMQRAQHAHELQMQLQQQAFQERTAMDQARSERAQARLDGHPMSGAAINQMLSGSVPQPIPGYGQAINLGGVVQAAQGFAPLQAIGAGVAQGVQAAAGALGALGGGGGGGGSS
jgi:hypothetical protein